MSECPLSKRQEGTSVGKHVEKREPLYIVSGNVTGTATMKNSIKKSIKNRFLNKLKIELAYDPVIPFKGI